MSLINQKRDSLQSFIKEQLFGPGILGVKIFRKKEFENSKELPVAIEYYNEILTAPPLALGYSTGILFPGNEKFNASKKSEEEDNKEEDNIRILVDTNSDEDEISDIAEEKVLDAEIDQFYPKFNGFSFALHKDFFNNESTLPLDVNFRTYEKVSSKEFKNQEVGFLIDNEELKILKDVFKDSSDIRNSFEIVEKNSKDKAFVRLKEYEPSEQERLKSAIESFRNEKIEEKLIQLFNANGENINKHINISTIREKIALKNKINPDFVKTIDRIQLDNHLKKDDLIKQLEKLFNLNAGLWECESHKLNLLIKNLKPKSNKTIFSGKNTNNAKIYKISGEQEEEEISFTKIFYKETPSKKRSTGDKFIQLSLNIQLTKDTRSNNDLIFVKCQFINTSSKFEEDDKRHFSPSVDEVNERAFFGFEASVEGDFIRPYNEVKTESLNQNNEDDIVKYNYRSFKNYAVGYNCSVGWNDNGKKVFINYLPFQDTPDIDPTPRNKEQINNDSTDVPLFIEEGKAQEFKFLSQYSKAENQEVKDELADFVEKYKEWIDLKRQKEEYQNISLAEQELDKCEEDYKRMKDNLQFLEDKSKMEVFRLMNSAMFIQLLHKEEGGKTGLDLTDNKNIDYKEVSDDIYEKGKSAGWRAFQLAFILLNLDGIWKHENDENWEKRNRLADLVWFPTGGGKTEAYLGLIALFILNRRIEFKDEEHQGKGVTAIMRYTLRLLTLQQFQRSSLLILGLEKLRIQNTELLGDEPISIGLWVGASSLPNRREDLNQEFNNYTNNTENNIPVQACGWCGSRMHLVYNEDKKVNELFCSNQLCTFSDDTFEDGIPLPFRLCDDDIYEFPPSLLFATVDKYAQLANKVHETESNNDSRRLFGNGGLNYLPPDLIIQDELHLLLGPLGSAVAQFEAVIEILGKRDDGTKPKVITSTATTRNTDLQIEALYNKEVNIFPKQGVECDDAYFSFYKRKLENNETKYQSKRRYLGIMPTGRSQVWMQFRLLAIMMVHRSFWELEQMEQNNGELSDDAIKAMDNYHSILNYFNSTREVGKSQSQIQTYLKKELGKIWENVISKPGLIKLFYRNNEIEESELTGRLKGSEVKDNLAAVEKKWSPNNRYATKDEDGQTINGNIPPEIIAATNMISVGLDVGRFNQILMNSMPRNTAEYIQASSRVARNQKGLVITLHHPFKTRDVSHYEQFKEFHQKLYSYVEPISITPFTKKSLERYFSLVVATIVRHYFDEFAPNNSAQNIDEAKKKEIINIIKEYFKKRDANVPENLSDILNQTHIVEILKYTDEMIQQWNDKLQGNQELLFKHPTNESLYHEVGDLNLPEDLSCWEIPGSLRIVEPGGVIHIEN